MNIFGLSIELASTKNGVVAVNPYNDDDGKC
jgi:hypothetical protein